MTAQELIAKVLELQAASEKLSYGYQEIREQALAAPVLARMLQEAILQRDAWATMIEEHKPYLEINNAKLDRIAKGE